MSGMMRLGFMANLPLAASVAAYGSILGVLASQKQISWLELLVMNLSIFAGSAQFVMVEMWIPPLPIVEITLAVLAINLRYLLIGASLQPIFLGKSLLHKVLMMHLVADENWAITMAEHRKGTATTPFLLGGGVCILLAWCVGTLTGHGLGAVVRHPEAYALDFVFVAVFTALLMTFWRGKQDVAPWLVAAAFAVAAHHMLPGKWYIVIGGIGGALVQVFRQPEPKIESEPELETEAGTETGAHMETAPDTELGLDKETGRDMEPVPGRRSS
jgi:4-azaleucine resistance transporter AzlC